MIERMYQITHSTPIGHLFDEKQETKIFEGDVLLSEVLAYFSAFAADAVIIAHESRSIGILTVKDVVRTLQDTQNLLLPAREFLSNPLHTFHAAQTVAEVLDTIHDTPYNKIVVTQENDLLGIIDRCQLLSLCYTELSPLIKHEYNLVQSILGLVEKSEQGLLQLATTDHLTGIGNRRLFEEIFYAHQALGEKYSIDLFLLMFDVDDFKKINDSYGHNVGDLVLKELVSLVSQSIRKSDVFIRLGGDEFALLLRHADKKNVADVAEQIRQRINAYYFDTIGHITCSFGLTSVRTNENLEEVIERADKALYAAKADGKNRLKVQMS